MRPSDLAGDTTRSRVMVEVSASCRSPWARRRSRWKTSFPNRGDLYPPCIPPARIYPVPLGFSATSQRRSQKGRQNMATSVTQTPAWKALEAHQKAIAGKHMRELFKEDPQRFDKFNLRFHDILLDFSKNRITEETLRLLLDLAKQADV